MKNTHGGFGIIEIMLAVSIITVAFLVIAGLVTSVLKNIQKSEQTAQALFYAKEGIEAVRSVKDKNWTSNIANLASGANYHPVISGSSWSLASNSETIGSFTRTIVVDNVSRDPGTKNIEQAYNAGNNHADTKKVTSTVSWSGKSVYLTTYITNILGN